MKRKTNQVSTAAPARSVDLAHVSDHPRRYVGEELHFFTRLELGEALPGWSLSVSLPRVFELKRNEPLPGGLVKSVTVQEKGDAELILTWHFYQIPLEGIRIEFETIVTVTDPGENGKFACEAVVRDEMGMDMAHEGVEVFVSTQSDYMRFLPEIYAGNNFLGRFMMLFESFWKPVEKQISGSDVYYDPKLAPVEFLPWLASWIGVPFDENLPVERQRMLLNSAFSIYQRFGTRQSMIDYLTLYTGGVVDVYEHRAQNFKLNREFQLGPAIALGRTNQPHTFTVSITVERDKVLRLLGANTINPEIQYRRKIETLINAQKPAHTAFNLELKIIEPAGTLPAA